MDVAPRILIGLFLDTRDGFIAGSESFARPTADLALANQKESRSRRELEALLQQPTENLGLSRFGIQPGDGGEQETEVAAGRERLDYGCRGDGEVVLGKKGSRDFRRVFFDPPNDVVGGRANPLTDLRVEPLDEGLDFRRNLAIQILDFLRQRRIGRHRIYSSKVSYRLSADRIKALIIWQGNSSVKESEGGASSGKASSRGLFQPPGTPSRSLSVASSSRLVARGISMVRCRFAKA